MDINESEKYHFYFFETNQARELLIILKRRNNTQIGHNKQTKKAHHQLDLDINTAIQVYNSSQALLYKTTTLRNDGSKTEALPQHPPTNPHSWSCWKPQAWPRVNRNQRRQTPPHQEGHRHAVNCTCHRNITLHPMEWKKHWIWTRRICHWTAPLSSHLEGNTAHRALPCPPQFAVLHKVPLGLGRIPTVPRRNSGAIP